MQFADFNGLIALEHIDLSDLFFNILIHVVNKIIRLKNAGIYLNQGIFPDKGIYNGLPDISGFCLCKVIICMVDLIGLHVNAGHFTILRTREVFDHII